MGVSSVLIDLKGIISQANDEVLFKRRSPIWQVVMRNQRVSRKTNGGHVIRSKRPTRITMKKRARLEGSRKPATAVERRVRTLKKLIPNGESMGVDGLFRETADYILALEMRVKVMKIMVKVLTGCDE